MNSVSQTIDVLIVGAGPTGLTLACDLARRGVAHRIIERSESYSVASRAKGIQPRSLEVADDLGAVHYIVNTGIVDLPARYYTADGGCVDKPGITVAASAEFETPYRDPVLIAQFDVEKALRDRYADFGGQVELGVEAVELAQDSESATITVNTPLGKQQIRARYVVGSDGGKSTIRKHTGTPLIGETHENERWYLGDVRLEGLDRDHIHIWTSPEGMIGVTPLPGTDIWQLQATIPEEIEEPEQPSLEMYQAMFNRRAGAGNVRLTDASWLSIYRINVRMAEQFRKGRVFLAGEAAHVHPATGGQGMNTGIQDGYNLGWKLDTVLRGADSALLNTYDEERRPIAQVVLQDSSKKMGEVLGTVTERGSLSQSIGAMSDDLTSGLRISYRSSSLTRPMNDENSVGPRPGDRAPDAKGLHGNNLEGSVFDLFRGTHWSLLVLTDGDEPLLPFNDSHDLHIHRIFKTDMETSKGLVDSEGNVYRVYGSKGNELVLVRPDGYIALRSNGNNARAIADYLAQVIPNIEEHSCGSKTN